MKGKPMTYINDYRPDFVNKEGQLVLSDNGTNSHSHVITIQLFMQAYDHQTGEYVWSLDRQCVERITNTFRFTPEKNKILRTLIDGAEHNLKIMGTLDNSGGIGSS